MRLLVGIDRPTRGRDAVELARVLAGGQGDSALVATVLFTGLLPAVYTLLSEAEMEESEQYFGEARARLGGIELETQVYGGGTPAGVLTRLAEEEKFDAIVVGSPRRGPLGRVLIGSVAESLLNGASTDVAVAPHGYGDTEHPEPRNILVGYDGTPESGIALRRAEALAGRSGARLKITTVVRPPVAAPVTVPGVPYTPEWPSDPEMALEEAVDSVEAGIAADGARLDGDPASELARASEDADLLVVGSRGYGPVTRVLLGSVSRPLVRKATCPVLVTPRP